MNQRPTTVLLAQTERCIRKYVVLANEHQATAIALFVLHTWAFEAAHATPYLAVVSPDKRSGKTRLLELLVLLVRNGWRVSNPSAAVIYRRIELESPTVLLDEMDTIFTRNGEVNEALRGILNAGNRPGAHVSRCAGDGHEPRDFNVYCAKVLAGIDNGRLPDTIRDRAILIQMQRKRPEETVERFRPRDVEPQAEIFREHLEEWAAAHVDVLTNARPEWPDGLGDRAAEAWEPLFAIADLAAGDWPQRAREAAQALNASQETQDDNDGTLLLAAIRDAFADGEVIPTRELLASINRDEELPFGELNRGRGMTAAQLARELRPFSIRPRSIRQNGNANHKGYHRDWFEDAWARYLSALLPAEMPPRRHIGAEKPNLSAAPPAPLLAMPSPTPSEDGPERTAEILSEDDLEPWQQELAHGYDDDGRRIA